MRERERVCVCVCVCVRVSSVAHLDRACLAGSATGRSAAACRGLLRRKNKEKRRE